MRGHPRDLPLPTRGLSARAAQRVYWLHQMSREDNAILFRYSEITLKGRNRSDFATRLRRNVSHRLRSAEMDWPVHQRGAHSWVQVIDAGRMEAALQAVGQVAGINWYAPACRISPQEMRLLSASPDFAVLDDAVVSYASRTPPGELSFRVRVNRGYKGIPADSPQMERRVGTALTTRTDWTRVNLKHPDHVFRVDVREDGVYIYDRPRQGMAGLPVGVGGRVLVLFSGGIDSPVAAYLMARRGCAMDFVHFTTSHPRPDDDTKITRMIAALSRYTLRSRLHLAPYVHFDMALMGNTSRYALVLFRRFIARVAEELAVRSGIPALVTGDSLGQVASQTLENLTSSTVAVRIPILRPLIARDKEEIINLARAIGTYRPSLAPYKDCCTLLGRRPLTRCEPEAVAVEEARLLPDYRDLVERTLADTVTLEFDSGRRLPPC